jgi:hypothetical protein
MTRPVTYVADGGQEVHMLVTVGFDNLDKPREVFCASFKAGTTMNAVVMDACILLSRLLQHGDVAAELEATMSQPHSMMGAIAAAVAECEK